MLHVWGRGGWGLYVQPRNDIINMGQEMTRGSFVLPPRLLISCHVWHGVGGHAPSMTFLCWNARADRAEGDIVGEKGVNVCACPPPPARLLVACLNMRPTKLAGGSGHTPLSARPRTCPPSA
jgi:hypothetical protein